MKKSSLSNKRIVLTRTEEDNAVLRGILETRRAEVLELPLIKIGYGVDEDLKKTVFETFGEYEWIVFTSVHGVEGFFKSFFSRFKDIRCIGGCNIACVGPATAAAVEAYHLQVDLVPEKHTGEALAEAMVEKCCVENVKICVITGNLNKDTLPEILEKRGNAIVDLFPVYETGTNDLASLPAAEDFRKKGAHAVVFASPSAVRSFIAQLQTLAPAASAQTPKVVAIGETTAAELDKFSVPVAAVAGRASAEGIVEALESIL